MFDSAPLPPASPASIAEGVRRNGTLQAAELQVAQLSARRAELVGEIREAIASGNVNEDAATMRKIKKLGKEREAVENQLRPLLFALREAKADRAKKVDAALADAVLRAAEEVLAGLAMVHRARAFLVEADEVVTAAGGQGGSPAAQAARCAASAMAALEWACRQAVEASR